MRSRLVLLAAAMALPVACSSSPPSGVAVGLVPDIVVPDDLIGQIAKYSLQIYSTSGGIGCDMATGQVTGDVAKATPIAQTGDISTSCPSGVSRCATLKDVAFQTTASVLSVTGFGTDGTTPVASGCAEAMIDQSSLTVSIKLVRVLPPEKCGDGVIQPKETCDDTTAVCTPRDECQTVEELLSYGDGSTGTSTGSLGQKSNPFFLWNATTGTAGALVAVYTDSSLTIKEQIGLRLMDETLSPPAASDFGMAASQSSFFLPNCSSGCSTLPPPESANTGKQPSAASLGGEAYVVFSSDQPEPKGNAFDIFYGGFAQSQSLTAHSTCPVNTPNGSAGLTNTAPSVAANGSSLFVAWQDSNGNVSGRAITPSAAGCGSQGTESDAFGSGVGSSTTGPKVAAAGSGWVVVWPSGSTVEMQLFDASGNKQGGSQMVGSGSNPSVASVPGSPDQFAVAWTGGKGVQVQRYKSGGAAKVSSTDASAAVNTTGGSASTPAIAGGTSAGGFYVVTWIDGSGDVRARLLSAASGQLVDASGYLFNTVDGTANDFKVNVTAGRAPANPTVAVGGNGGSYIAFGWEDHGSTCSASASDPFPATPCFGIVARRFPVPTQ